MSKDEGHLCDMLVAAREAVAFLSDTTLRRFQADRVLQAAVVHMIQIVGEAARQVSPEAEARIPTSH